MESSISLQTMLGDLIIELLEKYKSVHIDGLGCFYIKQLTSYDELKDSLNVFPPLKAILYRENCNGEMELSKIAELESWSDNERNAYDLEILRHIDELVMQNKTSIQGLGTLQRDEDKQIHLLVDRNPFVDEMEILPELGVNSKEPGRLSDFEAPEKLSQVFVPNRADHRLKSSRAEKKQELGRLIAFLALIVLLSSSAILIAKHIFFSSDVAKQEVGSKTMPGLKESELPAVKDMFANDNLNKYRDILTEKELGQGCEIVVGSFRKKKSAELLSSEVNSKLYKTYISQSEDLYRVVINFDCIQNDLLDYLLKVREEINPKAWYLSPANYEPFSYDNQ